MLTSFVILKFFTMINVQSGAYSLQDFVIKKLIKIASAKFTR